MESLDLSKAYKLAEACTVELCGGKTVTRLVERTSGKRFDICQAHRDATLNFFGDSVYELHVHKVGNRLVTMNFVKEQH